ncbi:MAG: hypothetical protein AAFV53_22915 [Myxococcota bacterium]
MLDPISTSTVVLVGAILLSWAACSRPSLLQARREAFRQALDSWTPIVDRHGLRFHRTALGIGTILDGSVRGHDLDVQVRYSGGWGAETELLTCFIVRPQVPAPISLQIWQLGTPIPQTRGPRTFARAGDVFHRGDARALCEPKSQTFQAFSDTFRILPGVCFDDGAVRFSTRDIPVALDDVLDPLVALADVMARDLRRPWLRIAAKLGMACHINAQMVRLEGPRPDGWMTLTYSYRGGAVTLEMRIPLTPGLSIKRRMPQQAATRTGNPILDELLIIDNARDGGFDAEITAGLLEVVHAHPRSWIDEDGIHLRTDQQGIKQVEAVIQTVERLAASLKPMVCQEL